MRNIFTLALLAGCLTATAQQNERQNLHQSIHDDGKTMRIDITGKNRNKSFDYHRSFDISHLGAEAKNRLAQHIMDSLGVSAPPKPAAGVPPVPPAPLTPAGPSAPGMRDISTRVNDDGKTMHLTIKGSQNGKAIRYSRTFNVTGITTSQKNALIKHITDSLGISNRVSLQTH